MTRLFVDEELTGQGVATIRGDAAHYLLHVMRCQPGFRLVAVDATGREFSIVVDNCTRDQVVGRILSSREPAAEPALDLCLYQALLKGKRFELALQKTVELGVSRIVPLVTERTTVRPDPARIDGRLHRWRKIALEASRQCGRSDVPDVEAPLGWADALAHWRASSRPGIVPYEVLAGQQDCALRSALDGLRGTPRLAAFIGPEGGFAPTEIDRGQQVGLTPVCLGPRILRAETAAIAVCTIVMYELESSE